VVKPVPEGATVIGVPGRLVEQKKQDDETRRKAMADKMGFDAYGATQDAPDPVAHAINCMLDHIHVLDERMQTMCDAIKTVSGEQMDVEFPSLDSCEIASTAEELRKLESREEESEGSSEQQ
jgi:serine O-acetyltransferase